MGTLLLRLAAPLQSWGDESKFDQRQTWHEPSKSAVIGMIASALGYRRDADEAVRKLNESLRFGVRVDQPGRIVRDFHTVAAKSMYVTNRYYLSDAIFVVGLETKDEVLLKRIAAAIQSPAYPLFLGRRSCPPTLPIVLPGDLGIQSVSLLDALHNLPWQAARWWKETYLKRKSSVNGRVMVHILAEAEPGQKAVGYIRDNVISFNPWQRRYGERPVISEEYGLCCEAVQTKSDRDDGFNDSLCTTTQDIFAELEEGY